MDDKMIEENEQKKKNKENKDSSAEMIDSFFGSHNLDNEQTNQNKHHNFKETKHLIDKVLGESSTSENESNSSDTEDEFFEKKKEDSSFQEAESSENKDSFENKNQSFNQHPKEEIFEIDKSTDQKQNDKKPPTVNNQFENNQKTNHINKKANQSKNQQKNGKIKFSLNLPKINIKFKGKKKQKKISVDQTKNSQNQEQNVFSEDNRLTNTEKSSQSTGRIHGLNKISKDDQQKNSIKQKQSFKKPKKSLFKSTNTSFHFFKNKLESEAKKPKKEQIAKENGIEEKTQKKTGFSSSTPNSTSSEVTSVDEDLIKLLKITDDLLGKLPEEVIEEFSQSEDFSLYEKVMKKYDIVK
ncbi:MAG: hypothetical protein KGY65_06025 [Candidatus Thermoplasmatota archaeon]|nr:hypothetical protein [Candidatus Thermoplasmatota archaeon]